MSDYPDYTSLISLVNNATIFSMIQETVESGESSFEEEIQNQNDEPTSRYKIGEYVTFVKVRFPGNSRSFSFALGRHKFSYGQKVVAMSDRGVAVGYINSFPYQMRVTEDLLPIHHIKSIASEEDVKRDVDTYKKEKEVETSCKLLIEKYKLDMNLTHVEFTQFGKKAVFYFTAPARVDFRDLVKDLVTELKTRIELRQISVRDRSAAVGGIGPCGRQLCCSSFLSKYGSVNIKMAKGQNLSLNSSKINGVCGQLKCCLKYEDEVYKHKTKELPKIGSFIKTKNGDTGRVNKHHVLIEQFEMLTSDGIKRRYHIDQVLETLKDFKMPNRFENISNELSTVIGLNDSEIQKAAQFVEDMAAIEAESKTYVDQVFRDLFGASSVEELLSRD